MIRSLSLQGNGVGAKGAELFAKNFEDNFTLQQLSLSANGFGRKAKEQLYKKFKGDKAQLDVGMAFTGGEEAFGGEISEQFRELRPMLEEATGDPDAHLTAVMFNASQHAQSAGGYAPARALRRCERPSTDTEPMA